MKPSTVISASTVGLATALPIVSVAGSTGARAVWLASEAGPDFHSPSNLDVAMSVASKKEVVTTMDEQLTLDRTEDLPNGSRTPQTESGPEQGGFPANGTPDLAARSSRDNGSNDQVWVLLGFLVGLSIRGILKETGEEVEADPSPNDAPEAPAITASISGHEAAHDDRGHGDGGDDSAVSSSALAVNTHDGVGEMDAPSGAADADAHANAVAQQRVGNDDREPSERTPLLW